MRLRRWGSSRCGPLCRNNKLRLELLRRLRRVHPPQAFLRPRMERRFRLDSPLLALRPLRLLHRLSSERHLRRSSSRMGRCPIPRLVLIKRRQRKRSDLIKGDAAACSRCPHFRKRKRRTRTNANRSVVDRLAAPRPHRRRNEPRGTENQRRRMERVAHAEDALPILASSICSRRNWRLSSRPITSFRWVSVICRSAHS